MLTITISTRALLIALIIAACAIAAVFATDALAGDDTQVQGDVNCDEGVDANDILDQLYDAAGFEPIQNEPCTDIGDAFPLGGGEPGPSGPPGPTGPPGPSGAPGISLFATVNGQDGTVYSGNATGAEKNSDGNYIVHFDRDLTNCSTVVSVGSGPGGAGHDGLARASISNGVPNSSSVQVFIYSVLDNNGTSSDFHVIIAC